MNSPFSTDKKYVDQHGVDYLYIGFHPTRTSSPFVFTRQDDIGVFVSDEKGNILGSDKKTLREVKPKITRWINIYQNFVGYETKEKADGAAGSRRIACVKVEFEKGEGL